MLSLYHPKDSGHIHLMKAKFRRYLVMQREINAVWAGGMINCNQSSPSMVQQLNNGVTAVPGTRYNTRDGM